MTKDSNRKFYFMRCRCASVFRGENFKNHTKTPGQPHGVSDKLLFCLEHGTVLKELDDETKKAFHLAHGSCRPPLRLSKKEMEGLFKGEIPKKEKAQAKEVERKKAAEAKQVSVDLDEETRLATDILEDLNKKDREEGMEGSNKRAMEEGSPIAIKAKRRRVLCEKDSEEEQEEEEESFSFGPNASSTPEEAAKEKEKREKGRQELLQLQQDLELSESESESEEEQEEEEGEVVSEEEETPEEWAKKEKERLKQDKLEEMREKRAAEFLRKDSIKKQQAWAKDNAVELTKERAFEQLNRRHELMRDERDKALLELGKAREELKHQVNFETKYSRLMVEKREWEVREKDLMEDIRHSKDGERKARKELVKAETEVEKMREEKEKALEGRRRAEEENSRLEKEVRELKKAAAATAEGETRKGIKPIRLIGHLACQAGKVRSTYFAAENLDKTMECYEDPSQKVTCHHVYVERDERGSLRVVTQNIKRKTLGTKLCLDYL